MPHRLSLYLRASPLLLYSHLPLLPAVRQCAHMLCCSSPCLQAPPSIAIPDTRAVLTCPTARCHIHAPPPFAAVFVRPTVRCRARMPCSLPCLCAPPSVIALVRPASLKLSCVASHPHLVRRRPLQPHGSQLATSSTRRSGSAAGCKAGRRELAGM
ncbi:hypothetical protein BD779DRAFT_1561045 [Infundibulicybe gibba]|nr:hypothetical protein BD779DRAFT_1561045 [Infundibulicybe gibba]